MKRYDTNYLLRLSKLLKAQGESAAAKAHLRFSEWVREALHEKLNGKGR